MMPTPSAPILRLITTNDFFGSYFKRSTSYGIQPGARSLVNTVSRLREGASAAVWVDAGDFAQGGPLAPASSGALGFTAINELGIDVATIGNHEFDWGTAHARQWLAHAAFPLAVANYDIGLPPSTLLNTGHRTVGVIGLTHPTLYQFNDRLSRDQPSPADIVPNLARDLRNDGADIVVLVIHDGVDWTTTSHGPLSMDTARMARMCDQLRDEVDVILGGHTLGRFIGSLSGVPFVQPWAFGAEVGVADLDASGSWHTYGVMLDDDDDWEGAGVAENARLSSETIGTTASALRVQPLHDISLADSIARGMSRTTTADISLVFAQQLQTMQAPIDGTFAYLPAGEVTEADVVRAIPFVTDDICQDIFVTEMTTAELDVLLECAAGERETDVDVALSPKTWGGPAIARRDRPASNRVSVAMASLYSERQLAETWVGRALDWNPAGTDLRDALRTALRD